MKYPAALFLVFTRTFRFRASIYAKANHYPRLKKQIDEIPIDYRLLKAFEMLKDDIRNFFARYKYRYSHIARYFPSDSVDPSDRFFFILSNKYMHSQAACVVKFNNPESIKGWSAGDDRWEGLGESTSQLSYDPTSQCAVFSGNIASDMSISNKGALKRRGFAVFRSPRTNRFLWMAEPYIWDTFTHLCIELRGDGRNWTLNLNTPGIFDIDIHDMFSYPIYTRGGPYWQTVRIPFSKFLFQNKGAIQDIPRPVYLDQIFTMSFCLMDHMSGPFRLDVKSIYVMNDMTHREKHAYETYRVPNLIVTGRG